MEPHIYNITILNWDKHNGKIKKGHTHFMLSKRIFTDQKIAQLKPIEFQIYVYLLSISAELVSNQFAISSRSVPRYVRINVKSFLNVLLRLQSFQLLTIENINAPYILEKNRIEETVIVNSEITLDTEVNDKKISLIKKPAAVENFENSLNQENSIFHEKLRGTAMYPLLRKYIPKIREHFENWENFEIFLVDIKNAYEIKKPKKSLAGWIALVVKKEIGAIKTGNFDELP